MLNYFIKLGIIVEKNKEGIAIDYGEKFNIGDIIDNYSIISDVSNRKNGELYKVIDKNGNEYILKTLKIRKFSNIRIYNKELISFTNENYFGSSLEHENLCRIYKGIFEKEWGAYYIMEFIDGITLSNIKNGTFELKNIINQILSGFNYLHKNGKLHGDIHLSNILVKSNEKIKIIDFGLISDINTQKTRNGGVCEFVAPERMNTDVVEKFISKNTIISEIYQIGVIYYFLKFGKLPFKTFTWKKIYNEKINFSIHNMDNIEQLSKNDLEIFEKFLSPNPKNRFTNLDEVLNHINK